MSICTVEGCEKTAEARGVCNTHYMQLRRSGQTPIGTRSHGTVEQRFWKHVNKDGDCWLWTAHTKTGKEYGRLGAGGDGGKYLLAHRVSYEIHYGAISDGMVVMHKCDNPRCVNPEHLTVGTTSDNIKDAYAKGRKLTPFKQGSEHHAAVLNADIVREVRVSNLKSRELAKIYGCSRNAIDAIKQGRTWKHID